MSEARVEQALADVHQYMSTPHDHTGRDAVSFAAKFNIAHKGLMQKLAPENLNRTTEGEPYAALISTWHTDANECQSCRDSRATIELTPWQQSRVLVRFLDDARHAEGPASTPVPFPQMSQAARLFQLDRVIDGRGVNQNAFKKPKVLKGIANFYDHLGMFENQAKQKLAGTGIQINDIRDIGAVADETSDLTDLKSAFLLNKAASIRDQDGDLMAKMANRGAAIKVLRDAYVVAKTPTGRAKALVHLYLTERSDRVFVPTLEKLPAEKRKAIAEAVLANEQMQADDDFGKITSQLRSMLNRGD
jgi:hypothetical protein